MALAANNWRLAPGPGLVPASGLTPARWGPARAAHSKGVSPGAGPSPRELSRRTSSSQRKRTSRALAVSSASNPHEGQIQTATKAYPYSNAAHCDCFWQYNDPLGHVRLGWLEPNNCSEL